MASLMALKKREKKEGRKGSRRVSGVMILGQSVQSHDEGGGG